MSKAAKLARMQARQQRQARTAELNDAIKAARRAGRPATITAQQLGLSIHRVKKIRGAYP